jgi:hypothetical protein
MAEDAVARVRQALAMSDAGYGTSPDHEDVAELLRLFDLGSKSLADASALIERYKITLAKERYDLELALQTIKTVEMENRMLRERIT